MKMKKSGSRFLSMLMTLVMVVGMMPVMAFAAEPAVPAKTGTATVTMMNETKDQPSMCDPLFDSNAELKEVGNNVEMKILVANPVPAFPDDGADGTVKNVFVTYNGTKYEAVSDLTTKPNMTAKIKNDLFGLTQGEKYPAQVLTVTLPKEAIQNGALLTTDAFVNVVMMQDVVFRLKLENIVWTEPPVPEATAMTLTYGDQTKNFDGTDLGAVGTFMKENAITNAVLKLNEDIPEFGTSLVVPAGATFTLDLNGHDLTTANGYTNIQAENFGVDLTITDTSKGEKKGTLATVPDNMMSYAVQFGTAIYDEDAAAMGSLTINNGVTLTDGVQAHYGNVLLDGVTVNGDFWIQGDTRKNVPLATIKNSTVNSAHFWNCALTASAADMFLDNSTVASASAPVFNTSKKLTIESGTYSTNGATIVQAASNCTSFINSGTFKSTGGNNYETVFGSYSFKYPEGKKIVYNTELDQWELGNLAITDNGSLNVIVNGKTEAKTSVTEAFADVNTAGGTIQLIADSILSGNSGIVLNKDIILDLNGHTLTLSPEAITNSTGNGALDLAENSSLTVKDSVGNGKLDFSGCNYGITLSGTNADFTLENGTIAGSTSNTISRQYWIAGFQPDYTGNILIKDGTIQNTDGTVLSLMDGEVGTNTVVVVSGGEIICTNRAYGISLDGVDLEMKGNAKIQAENGVPVTIKGSENFPTKAQIGGNTVLAGKGSSVINANTSDITLSDNVQIDYTGTKFAVNITGAVSVNDSVKINSTGSSVFSGYNGSLELNGGLYKMNDNTMFIEPVIGYDSILTLGNVAYKADNEYVGENAEKIAFYILASEANTDGYYPLVKRSSIQQTNALGQKVGYQNFEDLSSAVATVNNALTAEGTGDNAYTEESKKAATDAKGMAEAYLNKDFVCQRDIDLLAKKLNAAISELQTVGNVDPAQLADGVYNVNVTAMKHAENEASMSAGALAPTATLVINGDTKELHLQYKPLALFGLIGHLQQLWYYDGKTLAENNELVYSPDYKEHQIPCEVTEYYTTPDDQLTPVYEQFDSSINYAEDTTRYPGVFVIPLNYLDAKDNRYVCTVKVDAMGETTQDVDIAVLWGTAKAKPEGEGALALDVNNVNIKAGETYKVNASMVGAQDYDITYKSGNEQVASVENGVITGVGEGTTKIAVTATPQGLTDRDVLTRVITVNVNGKVDLDAVAAQAVIEKINAIGEVTLNSEAAITEARTAFDALTDAQKALVTNKDVLVNAEKALADLKQAETDKAAAQAVIDKINAIGEVTLESEAAIKDARAAYDALTPAQKELVTNADVLIAAEKALDELKQPEKPEAPQKFVVQFRNDRGHVIWKLTIKGHGGIFAPIILQHFKPVTWVTDDVEGGMEMRCGGYLSAKDLAQYDWAEEKPVIEFTIK